MNPEADPTPDGIPRPVELSPPAATTGRRRRVSRWDRPRHPHDWRWWVGGLGRSLMILGLLMFGFVAYQLWGTGIEYRQHQSDLKHEFRERVEELQAAGATSTTVAAPTTAVGSTTTSAPPGASTTAPSTTPGGSLGVAPSPWPDIELGDVIAWIDIPKIHKTVYAVAGIRTQDLKQGLGHYPDTPLPGQLGNAAFAGHRTTYGAPLYSIDELTAGDTIEVNTLTGVKYVYRMVGQAQIVSPSDYAVITDSDPTKATLTITSCHPRYSAKQRIVIHAELDTTLSTPSGEATHYVDVSGGGAVATDEEPDDSVVAPDDGTDGTGVIEQVDARTYEGAEGLSRGWFSDSAAWPQVLLWAAAVALVCTGGYLLDRRLRRYWPGIVLALVPFLVTLYFLYQNVNRLLPPDL